MDGAAHRIMIVDDDDLVREGMEMILAGAGHSVRSTDRGLEALRWLEEEPCDLVILDFSMPGIDGPELYRRILAGWPTKSPRVLFVSGRTELRGYEDDPDILAVPLLVKPFTLTEFVTAITRLLEVPTHVRI